MNKNKSQSPFLTMKMHVLLTAAYILFAAVFYRNWIAHFAEILLFLHMSHYFNSGITDSIAFHQVSTSFSIGYMAAAIFYCTGSMCFI